MSVYPIGKPVNRVFLSAAADAAALIAGFLLATLTFLTFLAAFAEGGGPVFPLLDPPGPPASTLPQVEPRIPISIVPFTINSSGSYFMTKNLTNNSGDGIIVLADDVTIDLNGFTLAGVPGAYSGISEGGTPTPRKHWTIRNGTIRGFPFSGIYSPSVADATFEDLATSDGQGTPALRAGSHLFGNFRAGAHGLRGRRLRTRACAISAGVR